MSRFSMRAFALVGSAVALTAATELAAAPPISTAAVAHAAAASKKAKKKASKKATGPTLSVEGFGINRLWVPHGHTIKSEAQCSEIVDGQGSPIGPPQEVIITAYVRATNIDSDAPTRFKDEAGGDDDAAQTEFSEPVAWSKILEKPGKGVYFGEPTTGDAQTQKETYHMLLASAYSEFGEYEGPSAEEFDGTYSLTLSVEVGGTTLTSSGKVVIECPYLR